MTRFVLTALLAGALALVAPAAPADELDRQDTLEEDVEESWSYQPAVAYQPNPRQIIQQKAMARAQHRAHRLQSMKWYGMSNLRPTASGTPFTSMYSPAWQAPGGRPFAWYASSRPMYIFR